MVAAAVLAANRVEDLFSDRVTSVPFSCSGVGELEGSPLAAVLVHSGVQHGDLGHSAGGTPSDWSELEPAGSVSG